MSTSAQTIIHRRVPGDASKELFRIYRSHDGYIEDCGHSMDLAHAMMAADHVISEMDSALTRPEYFDHQSVWINALLANLFICEMPCSNLCTSEPTAYPSSTIAMEIQPAREAEGCEYAYHVYPPYRDHPAEVIVTMPDTGMIAFEGSAQALVAESLARSKSK